MQHLRLVGVHEDGMHLMLADDEGTHFSVPLDEALRAAARRDVPRLGQLQIEISGGLRPKDVQSMIRAGLTAEEVAERAGWPVEKVHRYEGPILAEREHVAGMARQVRLRPRGGSHGTAPTLEARVSERLRSREIDGGAARWDSRRTDKGAWTLLLVFNAGGRQREAAWQFDPLARTVSAVDDEARWLSEDEDQQALGPIPAPHLSASTRPSGVYDVEAEGGVAAPTRRREGETVDLMAAMRERSAQRGRRRRPKSTEVPGLDNAPEEALPLEELAHDPRNELPPPAHTHPEDDPEVAKSGTTEERVGADAARRKARRSDRTQPVQQVRDTTTPPVAPEPAAPEPAAPEPAAPEPIAPATAVPALAVEQAEQAEPGAEDTQPEHVDRVAADDRAARPRPLAPVADARPDVVAPASRAEARKAPEAPGSVRGIDDEAEYGDVIEQRVAAPHSALRPKPAPPARKSGRPSVPSWDDIMFGRKND